MKERPILFSDAMVRAILSGAKTQTRRVVKPQPDLTPEWDSERQIAEFYMADECVGTLACPYGRPGDRLWVREAIRHQGGGLSTYSADGSITVADAWPWKRNFLPPMHCPRGLSRIDLEIVSVRVERLQGISRGDAMDEGCPFPNMAKETDPVGWFADLWCGINGTESWVTNPWVWVIEFRRVQP